MIYFIFLLPLIGALIVLFFSKEKTNIAGITAFFFALIEFILTLISISQEASLLSLPAFGVNLVFSFDKLAAIILLVISGATAIAILYSIKNTQNPEQTPLFYSLILFVLFGTTGVALSGDLIQFYIFWEAMLIPAWVLVWNWNEVPQKARYTSLKFFIITHVGAVMMLFSILWIYSILGTTNMKMVGLMLPLIQPESLYIITFLFLMGFIVKLAIFPFHTWLPDAYTSSVMPVTLILVGVMTNIGIYGFARFYPFFSNTNSGSCLSYPFLIMAVVTMFYGGFMALAEKNIKRVIAYSSISQMGYVLFGFATFLTNGMAGSIFNIFNQAATKLTLFMCIGVVAKYAGEKYNIDELGGWAKRLPFIAIAATAAVLSLVGAPPLLGFWPEFLTFSAGFSYGNYTLAFLALIASVLSAAYGLRLIRLVFFGELKSEDNTVIHPSFNVSLSIAIPFLVLIFLGVFPGPSFELVRQAVISLGFSFGG